VLFLDELPEFERPVLEALRQVLEERRVMVARARHTCVFPADFQLVAAANPCPCGFRGSTSRDCRCDDAAVARYRSRLSGALMDRIDLHVRLHELPFEELDAPASGADTRELAERVAAARRTQARRLAGSGARRNAEIPDPALDLLVGATPDARALLGRAVTRLGLSARAARRVLRVARTVADLNEEAAVGPTAVAEALAYRDDATANGQAPV
jgi:magnesium chelatase family protein